jgi:diguanylate cyclase (GGDEF)-like protein
MSLTGHRGCCVSLLCKLSCVCAFIVIIIDALPTLALDPQKTMAQYAHEVWNTKAGLPEADVMAILQTRDGYLWIGTEEGLARFDGVQFTVFDRKHGSLPNNRVQALSEASDGSLWIGTENGLARLRDHRFTRYTTSNGLPSNNIRSLCAGANGTLWITTIAGVRVWRNDRFERDDAVDKIAGTSPREFFRSSSGDIWMVSDLGLKTTAGGLSLSGLDVLRGKLVRTMAAGSDDALWIGTTTGLYELSNDQLRPYPLRPEAPRSEVTALLFDRDHNLWVGTLNDGLFRINEHGTLHYSVADGLSGTEVKTLYEDDSGDLWVGTFGGGLEVFRDTVFTPYGKPEGVSQDVVWSVTEDRDLGLWIGTQAGGLNYLRHNSVKVYSTRVGFTDDTVGSLFQGNDGTIWLGKDSGLSRFKDGRILGAPHTDSPLHEQIHSLYEDAAGTLWIGTRASGLVELKHERYTYFTTHEGLANNNIQAIIPSRNGGLWIGTLGGLSHFKDGKFTNLSSKDGLSADQVISLYEDPQGTLWIGSDGLNRLKDGKITVYGDREGLFDQNPLAILEDNAGYLWLSTNKGIYRVSKKQLSDFAEHKVTELTPISFGTADGMRSAECNGGSTPAAWKDREGNLWFATVAGVVKLDPRRLLASDPRLQVHIENISADKQYVAPTNYFRLPPGGHELDFHYSAPYFGDAGRVHYRYKLDGFDKDWVDAGNRMTAYYTNLPPGNYRFRVKAGLFEAAQKDPESDVIFSLEPRYYQTPGFYVASVAIGVAVVILIWIWTNRFMIARQNELKRLVKERTRELETEKIELLQAKAALAQQATHDSLTGLMNRAAIFRVLEEEMRQAEREKSSFAVILADLDHFKSINDTYGHLVGDQVLREFARRLSHDLRPYDHVGRFGGEEFLIVMPGLREDCTDRILDLHRELCDAPFVIGNSELRVTSSFGVAWFDSGIHSTEALLNLADQALYRAKANGRNRVTAAGTNCQPQSDHSSHKEESSEISH